MPETAPAQRDCIGSGVISQEDEEDDAKTTDLKQFARESTGTKSKKQDEDIVAHDRGLAAGDREVNNPSPERSRRDHGGVGSTKDSEQKTPEFKQIAI